MKSFSIAVIPGDGVGQEVVPAAMQVLDAVAGRHNASFDSEHFDCGDEY